MSQIFRHESFRRPARTLTFALLVATMLAGGCSSSDDETGKDGSSPPDAGEGETGNSLGGVDLGGEYRDPTTSETARQLGLDFAKRQQQPQDADRRLERIARDLLVIADENERKGYFDIARQNRLDVVKVRQTLYGDDSWQVTSAMIDLNHHKWYAALSDEARRVLDDSSEQEKAAVEFYNTGDYAKATDEALKVLKVWQDQGGEGQVHYAFLLYVLAGYQQRQGDFQRAESYHQQAVKLFGKLLGERHPDYASVLDNLAVMYQDQGHFDVAKPYFVRANEIRSDTLGTEHFGYALGLNNLAALYQDMGDLSAAAPLFQQVVDILAKHKSVGEQHVYYAAALKNLAVVYLEAGNLNEAQSLVRKALAIHESAFRGTRHINYGISKRVMGRIEQQRRDYKKAEGLLQESLSVLANPSAGKNPAYAKTQLFLGQVYLAQGKYQEAEPALKDSLSAMQLLLGPSHPKLARNLSSYAELLRKTGRAAQAGTFEGRAREIQARMSSRPTGTTKQ
jgi:tetratricopeptide (TPR) repeat protein